MPTPLTWDETGDRLFETGTKKGVLFVADANATDGYLSGVAWNGLTAVTESNSGAEETALWADDMKYASLRSAEEFGATIEAYQCPPEFYQCDGSANLATGVTVNLQGRKSFAFSYVTTIGNDVDGTNHGYKIHIVYGATASPSERAYQTINDSPEAITFSWEISSTPVPITATGYETMKPTASITIDSTKFTETAAKAKLTALEDKLFGTDSTDPELPTPNWIITNFA